jgi:hypothetical protein
MIDLLFGEVRDTADGPRAKIRLRTCLEEKTVAGGVAFRYRAAA